MIQIKKSKGSSWWFENAHSWRSKQSFSFGYLSSLLKISIFCDLMSNFQYSNFADLNRVPASYTWPNSHKISNFSWSMLMACHKKSYLICDEITNFQIFTQPIPKIFLKYKTETAKQGIDSCLKKINVT